MVLRLLVIFVQFICADFCYSAKIDHQGFYFFGDSLTDSGYQNNNPDVLRIKKTPQWTSPGGHVWVYYFMQNVLRDCKSGKQFLTPNNKDAGFLFNPVPRYIKPVLDGNNFAAGGSTTGSTGILNSVNYKSPSLLEQIQYFLAYYVVQNQLKLDKQTYLIWSGSNDLIKKLVIEIKVAGWLKKLHLYTLARAMHILDLRTISAHFVSTERQIANNLTYVVQQLQQAGAKRIVVLLLPDTGVTPLMDNLVSDFSADEITKHQLAQQMHQVVRQVNALIIEQLTPRHVLLVDINKALLPVLATSVPGYFVEQSRLFGKSSRFFVYDKKHPACPDEKALTCIPKVKQAAHYVFEDLLHPTAQTHHIMGDYVYFQLSRSGFLG